MRICLIDNEVDNPDYGYCKTIVEELISGFPDNIEFRKEFFQGLEDSRDENNIKSLLEEYDAIMYHSSKYSGIMDDFSVINEDANYPCLLIGFTGGIKNFASIGESDFVINRKVLYGSLKECIENAVKFGKIDINIFLNFRR